MIVKNHVRQNFYADSVALMRIAAELEALEGVDKVATLMASAANLELAVEAGLLAAPLPPQPNNLLIAVAATSDAIAEQAISLANDRLDGAGRAAATERGSSKPKLASLDAAVRSESDLDLALISCPGEYAGAEARKALNLGLNVMLFSDNVPMADEVSLKRLALERDLLLMGPDCGTAILNGVPLGFANKVAKGPVGIVGASGTGIQEVSSLLSRRGVGISQAIGTGSRDLSDDVGGIATQQGLNILANDRETQLIVLVSKPPSQTVANNLLNQAASVGKPVVVCFLGAETGARTDSVRIATTLDQAAAFAAEAVQPGNATAATESATPVDMATPFDANQQYLRGLFSGGTLCYEAQLILKDSLGPIWSNTPIENEFKLAEVARSQQHCLIDMGDDVFTRGRPHPMIDHRARHERILQEAADPEVAVILFDLVLGFGAHDDPAAEMARSISEAVQMANVQDRRLMFVGSVCGTDFDPQNRQAQIDKLEAAGAIIAESNAAAARLAAGILSDQAGRG